MKLIFVVPEYMYERFLLQTYHPNVQEAHRNRTQMCVMSIPIK